MSWASTTRKRLAESHRHNGTFLNTLGVAQYRVGQHQDAVETLTRSDKLNAARFKISYPADIAFIAMAHHQLGHSDEAHEYLNQLRKLAKTGGGSQTASHRPSSAKPNY